MSERLGISQLRVTSDETDFLVTCYASLAGRPLSVVRGPPVVAGCLSLVPGSSFLLPSTVFLYETSLN